MNHVIAPAWIGPSAVRVLVMVVEKITSLVEGRAGSGLIRKLVTDTKPYNSPLPLTNVAVSSL
jgi:hypothetical protein